MSVDYDPSFMITCNRAKVRSDGKEELLKCVYWGSRVYFG